MIAPRAFCAAAGQVSQPAKFSFSSTGQRCVLGLPAQLSCAVRHSLHALLKQALRTYFHHAQFDSDSSQFAPPSSLFFMHQGGGAVYPVVKFLNSRDRPRGCTLPAAKGKKEIHVY